MPKLTICATRCGQSTPNVLAICSTVQRLLARLECQSMHDGDSLRPGAAGTRAQASRLLHEEQRVEHDRFGEGDGQNRLHHDLRGRAGIASRPRRGALPINPTPMAAPRAARPTCMLPVIVVSSFRSRRRLD